MKASPATICSYLCSSSFPGCPSFGCMDWASMLTAKVGRFMQSSLGKEVGFFYQDPVFGLTERLSSELFPGGSVGCGIRGIHSKGWTRRRWWNSSASRGRWTSPYYSVGKPTGTSRGPRRRLVYKLGQLKFRELRGARAEGIRKQVRYSVGFTMRCWMVGNAASGPAWRLRDRLSGSRRKIQMILLDNFLHEL